MKKKKNQAYKTGKKQRWVVGHRIRGKKKTKGSVQVRRKGIRKIHGRAGKKIDLLRETVVRGGSGENQGPLQPTKRGAKESKNTKGSPKRKKTGHWEEECA